MEAIGWGGPGQEDAESQVYAARQVPGSAAGVSAAMLIRRRSKSESMMREGVFFSAVYRAPDMNPRLPAICRLPSSAGTEDGSPLFIPPSRTRKRGPLPHRKSSSIHSLASGFCVLPVSRHVIPTERKLRTSLRTLRKLYARVEKFDLAMLVELRRLPPAQRKAARNEIKAKLKKLNPAMADQLKQQMK